MLQPGQQAPDFRGQAVINGEFKEIKLCDYKGKYLVLFFYPADFTFVCPTEIIAFSDRAEEFRQLGAEVVACITDSLFSHLKWTELDRKSGGLGKMNIPLLADRTQDISRRYGVLKEDEGNAFRGLFLIDPKGNLRQITINDMPLGLGRRDAASRASVPVHRQARRSVSGQLEAGTGDHQADAARLEGLLRCGPLTRPLT